MENGRLIELRDKIDGIDTHLIRLFSERLEVCVEIGRLKKSMGLSILDRERELSKLESIAAQCPSELSAYACELYERIFELSRRYQAEEQKGD